MKPWLNVFLDTEFTNFEKLGLISIGLVSEQADEFYAENLEFDRSECSDFVIETVIPKLNNQAYALSEKCLREKLFEWLTTLLTQHEYLIIHVDYQGDIMILEKLLTEYPSMNRLSYSLFRPNHLNDLTQNEYDKNRHHALWDANLLLNSWKIMQTKQHSLKN